MLTLDEARGLAHRLLGETIPSQLLSEVRLQTELSLVLNGEWIVSWDKVAFLDHGDIDEQLTSNFPIAVDMASGNCRYCSFEECLQYARKGLFDRGTPERT